MSSNAAHYSHGSPHDVYLVSGSTFDGEPYQIALESTEVAHGASGKIFRGKMLGTLPWIVAVKVIPGLLDPVMEALLARELRAARAVSVLHPYILPFLGTANVGGRTAIVSVFMDNGNLKQYIKLHPECDKKKPIVQVADAVGFLHGTAGLVHGDIKCENVLISYLGDALLADFGLSTFAEKTQAATATMTAIRQMNTLQFAAPELLLGEGTITPSKTCASDVYAFGMLVLEALSEELPWPKHSNLSVMQEVCSGQHPARPRDGPFVSISHSWWQTCLSCWNFVPCERAHINAVITALRSSEPAPCHKLFCDEEVYSCVYTPDGKTRVAGCSRGSIALFDTMTGQTRYLSPPPDDSHAHGGHTVAVSPNGQRIAHTLGRTIMLRDAVSGKILNTMEHGIHAECIAYSADGTLIASGGTDGTLQLWNAATGAAVRQRLRGHSGAVLCVSFSPHGTSLASGSHDGTIRLWDSVTGAATVTLSLQSHHDYILSISFSPDGMYLASGCYFEGVVVWDVREMHPVQTLKPDSGRVKSVAFSPSGQYVAAGTDNGDIHIWDVCDHNQIGVLSTRDPKRRVLSIAFSPDGRSLVSSTGKAEVFVWDLFE